MDKAILPRLCGQSSAIAAVCSGVQPGQLPASPGAATARRALTTLREKLIKIGAKAVHHANYVTFQLAEVAVPRKLFAAILKRIQRLRAVPGMTPS
ncbi:MAG: hypothetical protein DHS20C16_12390 [Phycisphaerae bacterium]|nr:MAG: hypothetical protein DHS20C16_12390 [Phycisphaerae bacterium]